MNILFYENYREKVIIDFINEFNMIGGIPKVFWFGEDAGYNILVMELLNENLEEMYNRKLKRDFTMMTILLLSD